MYSGETSKRFSKQKRQLRDSIIQCSVYKYSLLTNTELNTFLQHQIDRTDDKFVQCKVRRLLLLGLRARGVSSRRDGSKIFFINTPLKYLKSLHIKHYCTCPKAYLERTSKLNVLGFKQFMMNDQPINFLGCV
jgi:hypothetical protein